MSGLADAAGRVAARAGRVGRRNGGLSAAHPADLGAHVIRELVARTGIDPVAVDDVIFGCVDTL